MIPRVIHRVVGENVDPRYEQFWQDWCALHPTWEHRTWQDPLDPADWPLTAPAWPFCTSGAQLAGLVRLEAVWREGGIYLDADIRPLGRPLDDLLPSGAFVAWEDDDHIADFVFGAEPGHPAILQALCTNIAVTCSGQGAWEAAVGAFTRVMSAVDVLWLPPDVFAPVHYTEWEKARDWIPADSGWRGNVALGVHEYAGSWLPPEMRDRTTP